MKEKSEEIVKSFTKWKVHSKYPFFIVLFLSNENSRLTYYAPKPCIQIEGRYSSQIFVYCPIHMVENINLKTDCFNELLYTCFALNKHKFIFFGNFMRKKGYLQNPE